MESLEYAYHLNINIRQYRRQVLRGDTSVPQLQQEEQVLNATKAGYAILPTYGGNFLQRHCHRKTRMIK